MEILNEKSDFPKQVALVLGFFDGIHVGHRNVINNTPNCEKVIVTFSSSPAEFFDQNTKYIYPRCYNYKLMESLGVNYVYEQDFSQIVNISAERYLQDLIEKFNPVSISTGFNHTFGYNREGNSSFLKKYAKVYKYYETKPVKINNEIVSSTLIKKYLNIGDLHSANKLLTKNFSLQSKVIEGIKLGRKLGFPTANLKYPEKIIKIPYGVYKIKIFDKPAIMNWGIKPTIGAEELIEIHIPNFNKNLYNEFLEFEVITKIRNEKKFESLDELKNQISKDVLECLR